MRRLRECLSVEQNDGSEMRVSYTPPDTREAFVWDLLGRQTSPCIFELTEALRDALFPQTDIEHAEAYNVTERHLGLDDRFVGWSFSVRYERAEDHFYV